MSPSFGKFKKDLHSFHKAWEEVSKESSLLESEKFLLKMAHEIENIHEDIQSVKMSKEIQQEAEIVDYLLQSPWGAPFVFEKPLLEAARSFQNTRSPELHDLIKEFLYYKDEINHQLFDYVEEIEKTLRKYEK